MKTILKMAAASLVMATIAQPAAQAQGLLGTLLQKSRAARPGPQDDPGPQMAPKDGVQTPLYEINLLLKGGIWSVLGEPRLITTYSSAELCEAQLPDKAGKDLDGYAVRPMAGQFLTQNVLVVKDGADPDAPQWKIGWVRCGQWKPDAGEAFDDADIQRLTSMGIGAAEVVNRASQFVRTTDGSFPPPATKADLRQAANDKLWLQGEAVYLANGELYGLKTDQYVPFQTADDCKAVTSKKRTAAIAQGFGSKYPIGESIIGFSDGSGWQWMGCVLVADENSHAFANFMDTRMTTERAKSMKLILNLTPAAPSSKRGQQLKF